MSEREKYKAWAKSKGLTPYGKQADHFLMVPFGWEAWDERARIAAEREADMARLLLYAECPECDGSGVKEIDAGSELAQCQWCHERDAALATHEHNEGEL